MKSSLNQRFISDELVWQLRLSVHELNKRTDLAPGYLNQLLNKPFPVDVQLSTIDTIWMAAMVRYAEIGVEPPDDLWERLVYHDLTDGV